MQFTTILASIATLAIGADAAAVKRDTHVADFRIYGEKGCDMLNLGVWTVLDTDFYPNECKTLKNNVVKSLSLGDINNGCTMYIYSDEKCSVARRAITPEACHDAEVVWGSWSMQCATDANGN
ncbi:Fc.00g108260.m01.CDS01 [Cosmosporella sp. VM-42]